MQFSRRMQYLAVALVAICSIPHARADDEDDCPCCAASSIEESPPWVNYGGIIILLVCVAAMFWALALVCEEFFVPALNVLCEEWKIPDDVAGATFMAAGASSPELFTSFIGLIIYDSNIGVGTVVGSEIFNHMIISAGSVLFAKDGVLQLDARIVLRDLAFYVGSLLLLIYSLKDVVFRALPKAFDSAEWDKCLEVTTLSGGVLLIVYVGYALTAGNYQRLTRMFCPRKELQEQEAAPEERTSKGERMSRVSENKAARASFSPIISANAPQPARTPGGEDGEGRGSLVGAGRMSENSSVYMHMRPSELARITKPDYGQAPRRVAGLSKDGGPPKGIELRDVSNPMAAGTEAAAAVDVAGGVEGGSMRGGDEWEQAKQEIKDNVFSKTGAQTSRVDSSVPEHLKPTVCESVVAYLLDDMPPSDLGCMETADTVLRCYLSIYQDCIGLDAVPAWMTWQLRYFTIDQYGLHSLRRPDDPPTGTHVQIIDLSTATGVAVVDPGNFLFNVNFANVQPTVQFRAPTMEVMECAMKHLAAKVAELKHKKEMDNNLFCEAAQEELWMEHPGHEHSLIAMPQGRYAMWWHVITFPLKAAFHYTLVDVRGKGKREYYGRMIGFCTFYLALLSYIMILCCNYIGDFVGTTPTVMGLTLSAVGTSFPNLWSSMIVARQGYGNMAICNALGSNIFNVNVALGLPWLVFLLLRGGKPYDEMKDHGIVMFVLLLEIVSFIWLAMIWSNGFRILAWMAPVFVVIYVIVIVTAVALS